MFEICLFLKVIYSLDLEFIRNLFFIAILSSFSVLHGPLKTVNFLGISLISLREATSNPEF